MALPGRLVALSLALIAVAVLLVAELLTRAGGREPRSGQQAPAPSPSAVQIVHRDKGADGTYRPDVDQPVRRRFAGCMLMHADHDHWHFDAMASYVLRDPATDEVLAAQRKVSFCLRDNRRARDVPTQVRREYFGECSRTTRQGISPGWIDVYSADLPGQALPLPPGRRPRRTARSRRRLLTHGLERRERLHPVRLSRRTSSD